jgi:1,2-diacylglycerol 3-alpha-glucosyltransferase
MSRSAARALICFRSVLDSLPVSPKAERDWEDVLAWIKAEWDILSSVAVAGTTAVSSGLFADDKFATSKK